MAGLYCTVALGELLTPACLCHQTEVLAKEMISLAEKLSNRGPGGK